MPKNITTDKQAYRDLSLTEQRLPIFFRDWWLDCVCGSDHWQVILYYEDPNIVAVMPYFTKSQGPFKYVTMPVFTKFMGAFFIERFSEKKQQSILSKMLAALPDFSGFTQTLHYSITNWLPYRWAGFRQTAFYSYQIADLHDLDRAWQEVDPDYRNNKMLKAKTIATISEDLDYESFLEIINKPFDRQNLATPYLDDQVKNIYKLAYSHQCGKSFYAHDREGKILAAILIVWDSTRCYLLLAGENELGRNNGAGILTIWHGITYAAEQLKLNTFDFLGGMAENLERTRRQFGAQQISYFLVERNSRLFDLSKKIKSLFKGQ